MTVHEEVTKHMLDLSAKFSTKGITLEMPPQSNVTLGTEYIEMDYGKSLSVKVNYNPRFANQ